MGRVLATQYEEVVVDRLFAGNVQLVKALQPLVQAAESTLQPYREETSTDDCARGRWGRNCRRPQLALFRVVMRLRLKSMEARRVLRLAKTVAEWVQDPDWSERSFGWVTEPPTDYVRPVKRIVVRCQRQDGTYAYGILICSLSDEQVLAVLKRPRTLLSDPTAILTAYVNFYDQRGGGIETSGLR